MGQVIRKVMGKLMEKVMEQMFKKAVFTEEDLNLYQDCTYFSRKDILRLYGRFCSLGVGQVDTLIADTSTRLSFEVIQDMPELRQNPFKERLCEVFSTDSDGINFEDFLDMFSVLSVNAPLDLKATYAFRIYDYNDDNVICIEDIITTLKALTGDKLAEDKVDGIANKVLSECDVINDGVLSYSEFEHVVNRSPDFVSLFHITI